MVEKKIKFNFIKRIIKNNSHLFPSELSIIKIYFPNGSMAIDFIDNNNENVTAAFMDRLMADSQSLYKKILSEIEYSEKLENLEKECVHIHNANFRSNLKSFVNGYEIQKMLNSKSIYSVTQEIGISYFVLWSMTSDSKNDYRLSILLKICDYFKVSIFRILNKEYGKELLDITLTEFAVKAKLSDDERKVLDKIKSAYYN